MPTELEQYLFDHQFDFEIGSYDAERGCVECGEDGGGHRSSYGLGVGGHESDCELAEMLARAGFTVAYRADAQGCVTLAEYERGERYSQTIKQALDRGLSYQQAVMQASIQETLQGMTEAADAFMKRHQGAS